MEENIWIKLAIPKSLLLGCLIALSWAVYCFVVGSVPAVTGVEVTNHLTIPLSFSVSRWWDVLVGLVWPLAVFYALSKTDVNDTALVVCGLIISFLVSLLCCLIWIPSFSLIASIIIGAVIGLILGPRFLLGFGLSAGLVFCLIHGIVFGLGSSIALAFIFGQIVLVKLIISKK